MNYQPIAFSSCLIACTASLAISDEPVSMAKLTVELRSVLKNEATSRGSEKHAAAVVKLCDLYATLRGDPRHESTETMKGLAARARRRLLDVSENLRLKMKKEGIPKPEHLDEKLKAVDRIMTDVTTEQQSYSDSDIKRIDGGRGPGGDVDNGWMLIELITRTISPSFWDQQGGPGSMVYYPLQRALIVRATTRVHEDVATLLRALGGLSR